MTRYVIAPEAERDIEGIWDYIATDNPTAADRLLDIFHEKMELAIDFPGMGKPRARLAPGLRRLVAGNYLLFYRPTPDGLELARVIHSARKIRQVMFKQ